MSRIVATMREEAMRFADRATAYAMTGESALACSCRLASNRLLHAATAVELVLHEEREAQEKPV